jgi:hypothetical protein
MGTAALPMPLRLIVRIAYRAVWGHTVSEMGPGADLIGDLLESFADLELIV